MCRLVQLWNKGIESFPPNHFVSIRWVVRSIFGGRLGRDRVKHLLWILCVVLTANAAAQEPSASTPQIIVIRAGTLIDGKASTPRRDQVIVIRGNHIESVSDAASAKTPAGATVIDLSKATVLPGLIDSHTHIFLQGEDPAQGGYDANILNAPLALRAARATVAPTSPGFPRSTSGRRTRRSSTRSICRASPRTRSRWSATTVL